MNNKNLIIKLFQNIFEGIPHKNRGCETRNIKIGVDKRPKYKNRG